MHNYVVVIKTIISFGDSDTFSYSVIAGCKEDAIDKAKRKIHTLKITNDLIREINCYDLGEPRE